MVTNSASLAGLTTSNGGDITLTTQGGNLVVTKAITANGSGYIDLRTAVGVTSGNIVLDTDGGNTDGSGVDSGKLVSGSGTVSVIAGGAISTTKTTDGAAEIDTTGSVLLEAKNTIGTDANRIEIDNAAKLAARTLGGVASDDMFLRKLGTASALEVGTVNRVNATAVDNAITAVVTNSASLAGLTTSDNGHITLTAADATITVTAEISANGSGNVDLRAAGTNSDIAINVGTIKTGSGTIQLVAADAISTSTTTNTTAEFEATAGGKVLLQAGHTIGGSGNAIDMKNVAIYAAKLGAAGATGDVVINQTAGDVTVGSVMAVNAPSSLDGSVADLAGVASSNNRNITMITQGASNLHLASPVNAGAGVLMLQAGQGGNGGVTQGANGGLTASAARIDAGGDAILTQAGNRVNALASSTNRLEYLDAGVLAIGSVAGESSVSAADSVWIRARGLQDPANPEATALSIPVGYQVTGNGTGLNAVVLVADGAFWNYAGATAIATPNSRWLVYDVNQNLEYRLGGLPFDWRRVAATYESFPPSEIADIGNVYLTTAMPVKPQQFVPLAPFDPAPDAASPGFPSDPGAPALAPFTVGQNVVSDGVGTAQLSSAGLPIFPVEGVLSIVAGPGKFFEANLAFFTAGETVGEAFLANGAPLPAWLKVDLLNQRVFGVMPKEGGQHLIKLRLKVKSGEPGRVIEIVLSGNIA